MNEIKTDEDLRLAVLANSPITFEFALKVWGDPDVNLHDDTTRHCFFAVWALVQYEYADAVINQIKNRLGVKGE